MTNWRRRDKRVFLMLSWAAAIALACPIWTSSFSAEFDGEKAAQQWYYQHYRCKMGEDESTGAQLSADQEDAACWRRQILGEELTGNGWCFDQGEQQWALKCPIVPAE